MNAPGRRRTVAVAGPGTCDAATSQAAHRLGAALAELGCVVVTGGRGGVMEAASRGGDEEWCRRMAAIAARAMRELLEHLEADEAGS